MVVTCTSCSAKLTIPDDKVPKNVASFVVPCPKCQTKFQVSTSPPPSPEPQAATPAPAVEEEAAAPSPQADDDFVENRRLAMVCMSQPQQQAGTKAALEGLGYTVHVPANPDDAIQRLRKNRYEVVILHEEYGGSSETNLVLQTIQPMVMPLRRHMCVGLVGKEFHTLDNMMAFVKSVNFVVAERELGKIKPIVRQAVTDNDQFYRVFREAMRDAGKM
jgi:hypothetical protein